MGAQEKKERRGRKKSDGQKRTDVKASSHSEGQLPVERRKGQIERRAGDRWTVVEMQRLLQELQIHQIELEMQNEELKTARNEAEAQRELYLDLYDFAPIGYFTLDSHGIIRQVNLAGARLLGMERSRLLGCVFTNFISEADVPVFNAFLEKVFVDRVKDNCAISLGHEGCPRLHVHVDAVATSDGRECRVAVLDVTQRKRAEDDLQRLHEELEQLVGRRTMQLKATIKELEDFGYSVSHDLQTPLRAIDGYSRMLLKSQGDQLNEESRRWVEVIRDNIRKMGQLIQDLLAFARLGRKSLDIASVDMATLVKETWEDLRALHPDRSLTFRIGALPKAMADKALIRQVISNILLNAIKFSQSRDEAIIEVDGYAEEAASVYIIKDNGVGFDMAYYNKLFGMFQLLHDPNEYEGTGVGLAIAERIISRHGGCIWAEAKVNEGASFFFSLPSTHSG